jgi:peptide/nickel transport system permease protein
MLRKLFKQSLFLTGFSVCAFFFVLGVLGYSITPDSSVDANQIMPEWASLSPGTQVKYVEKKRIAPRSFFYWLTGDDGLGELISISDGDKASLKNNIITFFNDKTGLINSVHLDSIEGRKIQSRKFLLGTDRFGRDIYSRLVIGTRVSLSIGFLAMMLSLVIGVFIGLISGYFGGKIDLILTWLITVFWSVPTLLIALGLSFFLGKGYFQVLLATGLSSWVEVARVVRGQTMQLKNREFILSAKITGFSSFHIMFKHILPNLKGSLSVLATTNFAAAILLEAGLGFLGLGVAPPTPSWGIMVKENLGYLVLDQAYLAIIPGLAIMILVMAFNLMSMGFKDVES